MSRFLSHRPLKSNARLAKAWQRKSEKQEYQTDKWYSNYSERPRKPKMESLEVVRVGNHRLQLITSNTCKMYINQEGFKLRIEPEGKMSIRRTNTPTGAEYTISFAGSEEWEYIKAVFQTFAFITGTDNGFRSP